MPQTINIVLNAIAGGTVDAITVTYSPAIIAYSDLRVLMFRATGANASATPTLNVNGLGAKTIVKKGGQPLVAGDIPGANAVAQIQFDLANDRFELLNPASDEGTELTATLQTLNATIATLQTISVPTDSVVLVETKVICRKSAGGGVGSNGDGNTYVRIAKAKNVGGVVTLQTVQASFTAEDFSTHNATFDVSGTDLRVRVTGTASNTIDWKCFTTIKTLS